MSKQRLTVLSVRQPWASLLLSGEDWCENRSWDSNHRGPLWIHASTKIDEDECERYGIDPKSLETGAILGVVNVADVVTIDDLPERVLDLVQTHDLDSDVGPEFIVGEYCWIVTNPQTLVRPIPVKGKLNLWKHDADESELTLKEKFPPLITRRPESSELTDDEDAEEANLFIVEMEDGRELQLEYFLPDEDDRLHVEFLQTGEERVIVSEDDPAYTTGTPDYQIACELAWDEYPHMFEGGENS
ncbi:MAG: ASCH domain-containing protein [Planctomycetaceae bacterium]